MAVKMSARFNGKRNLNVSDSMRKENQVIRRIEEKCAGKRSIPVRNKPAI
jgi:hypothetical protein